MPKPDVSKRLRFWSRFTLFVGMVALGLYFVFDPTTPKLYKLLMTLGVLGFLLFFFMGSGGGKGGPLGGKAPPTRWFGGH